MASRMCCFIGATPRTKWLDGVVARDDLGFDPRPDPICRTCAAGRWTGHRTIWKQVCRVCLLQVTCWRPFGQTGCGRGRRGIDGRDAGPPLPVGVMTA